MQLLAATLSELNYIPLQMVQTESTIVQEHKLPTITSQSQFSFHYKLSGKATFQTFFYIFEHNFFLRALPRW